MPAVMTAEDIADLHKYRRKLAYDRGYAKIWAAARVRGELDADVRARARQAGRAELAAYDAEHGLAS